MKRYPSLILVALVLIGILCSCKKNSTDKDYGASIKDKTWWGQLSYTGKPLEYYSVHFKADNSLLWSQLSGDYPGQWVVNGKQLTMTFPGISTTIKADISDDRLMDISDDNAAFAIANGERVLNPTISLDNTIWKGTFLQGGSEPYQMKFMPGLKVQIKIGIYSYAPYNYTRSESGAVIKFTSTGDIFFGVVTSGSEMKGHYAVPQFPWEVTKQ